MNKHTNGTSLCKESNQNPKGKIKFSRSLYAWTA